MTVFSSYLTIHSKEFWICLSAWLSRIRRFILFLDNQHILLKLFPVELIKYSFLTNLSKFSSPFSASKNSFKKQQKNYENLFSFMYTMIEFNKTKKFLSKTFLMTLFIRWHSLRRSCWWNYQPAIVTIPADANLGPCETQRNLEIRGSATVAFNIGGKLRQCKLDKCRYLIKKPWPFFQWHLACTVKVLRS